MQGRRRFLTTSCLLLWTIVATTAATIVAGENPPAPPSKSTASSTINNNDNNNNNDNDSNSIDAFEDEIVREAIEAGRGHRDAPGTRDQWDTQEEHIGQRSSYDIHRRPPSPKVERLLNLYRLTCDDCTHDEATAKINAYVVRTKEEVRQSEKRETREWWKRMGLVGGAVVTLAVTVWYTWVVESETTRRVVAPVTPIPISPVTVVQQPLPAPPTWLDNEKKEIWNDKQEKQFQKALREFGGVNKKERYVLIAAQVLGKTRIECLTHHRMQQLMDQERLKDQ
mmetsp:Transcript_28540/g.33845  ORF Transcript_28540/g.33845 Transcript_28540/m.33845 type:complete len:282 (-) Transcript_28540:377-1222(-)